jgi:WD40 repeat protein
MLASTSTSGKVRLWEVATRRELAILRGHILSAWGAAFSPDSRRLATGGSGALSGGANDAVKLWDLATHRELLTLPAKGQIFIDIGFSPDGNILAATSLDGLAHLWRAPSWQEIEAAERGPRFK